MCRQLCREGLTDDFRRHATGNHGFYTRKLRNRYWLNTGGPTGSVSLWRTFDQFCPTRVRDHRQDHAEGEYQCLGYLSAKRQVCHETLLDLARPAPRICAVRIWPGRSCSAGARFIGSITECPGCVSRWRALPGLPHLPVGNRILRPQRRPAFDFVCARRKRQF